MLKSLQTWWQRRTGEDDSPFDGDTAAFGISLFVHLAILVTLGLIPLWLDSDAIDLTLTSLTEKPEKLLVAEEFYHNEAPTIDLGANSEQGVEAAQSEAAIVSEQLDVPNPVEMEEREVGEILVNNTVAKATGKKFNENLAVRGHVGADAKGAEGAIDRITHEILLSLEERKTLVVWLFDQSGSLNRRRREIYERFDRIYEELGLIEAAGNENFKKYEQPLLSAVWAFGTKPQMMTEKETANVSELKEAVKKIQQDDSGVENVFTTVYQAASRYEKYRRTVKQARRNVMLIAVTDEVGDDQNGLDATVKICRRLEMPVYVVGVPAPFGRKETMVKWVDPDPKYDQSPQWGRVDQGPESLLPERIKLYFAGQREDTIPLDSGFGPFALTRLCYETGGIYFAIHPNRNVNRAVNRRQIDAFSAHIKHFFDPQIMRRYQPDYVSAKEYMRRAEKSKLRAALLQAAQMSWVTPMEQPVLRFVKRDEAAFANELSQAQQQAALLEPRIQRLFATLAEGEKDRDTESSPRWLAGYDLAMGRLLAVKVRTESYNAMLAAAKRGLKSKNPKSNTWTLKPSNKVSTGSKLANQGKSAREYLQLVIDEHAGTPWAMLAERELKLPVSWEWVESFTDLNPPRQNRPGNNNNNNPAPGVNDRPMMLKKPPPRRPPPKL